MSTHLSPCLTYNGQLTKFGTDAGKSIVAEPADQTDNGSGDMASSVTSFEIVIKASHLNRARLVSLLVTKIFCVCINH